MEVRFLVSYVVLDDNDRVADLVGFADTRCLCVLAGDIITAYTMASTRLWNMYEGKRVSILGVVYEGCLEELDSI